MTEETKERTQLTDIEVPEDELNAWESETPFVRPSGDGEGSEKGKKAEEGESKESEKGKAETPGGEGETEGKKPESSAVPEKSGDEELVLELDGETYDQDFLVQAVKDSKNKSDWQKSNTEKSQAFAKERKAFEAKLSLAKKLITDEEFLDAVDDILEQGEENPFRGLDLEAKLEEGEKKESKSDEENRIAALEQKDLEREQKASEAKLASQVEAAVEREISDLFELDPGMKEEKNQQAVIDFAVKETEKREKEGMPPMFIKEAWLETRGRNLLTRRKIEGEAEEGSESVSGKERGIKETKSKTPAADYNEAMNRALSQYQTLEEG